MTTMRKLFHERLDQLAAELNDMVVLVEKAMRDATTALFTTDPASLWETARIMGDRALALVAEAARAVATRNAAAATHLDHDDDRIDQLQQDLYRKLLAGTPGLDAETAVELALLGRFYERYADHAVDLGRGIAYLTGRNTLDAGRV